MAPKKRRIDMRYAATKCELSSDGKGHILITGPYWDDPARSRTVTVNSADFHDYQDGKIKYIQDAFPYLSSDDREFLISGMSPEGWEKTFGKDE
jgi:hypothetical protein